jgi:PleD family two-component response regulator
MESGNNEYFNLPMLLKHDELNIRQFAASEPSLPVDEYFMMLSEFIRLGHAVENALIKFIGLEGDKEAYKSLDSMIKLLNNMRCDKFIIDFHSLLDAYEKKGNWREACAFAKKTKEEFSNFHARIAETRIYKKPDILSDGYISLDAFIKRLDEEEAKRKMVILAVDDSPGILQSVLSVLNDEYKVFTLSKSKEMEKVLQKLTPDLFLLDYQMPELNGFDLIPIIRNFEEHKETPIIFLTSEGTVDNLSAAIALGVCDYIVKPFNPEIIREKIAKHIIRKKTF